MTSESLTYQIKVTLNGIRPSVWRRLLVPSSVSLKDLHGILQVALGWTNSHLHQFIARGTFYGQLDPEFGTRTLNERRVLLSDVLGKEKDTIVYEYDFGDGWAHKIVLEKILENAEDRDTASCIAGARSCPPEDCGGVPGYAQLLQIISDASHPEHEEMLEWLGEGFDPERFDAVEINALLAKMKRRRQTIRPTRGRAPAPRHGRSTP